MLKRKKSIIRKLDKFRERLSPEFL